MTYNNNRIANMIDMPEYIAKVADLSFGFNTISAEMARRNIAPLRSDNLDGIQTSVGNTSISADLVSAPVQSGPYLLVQLPAGDTRWRVKSTVYDNNTNVNAKIIAISGDKSLLTLERQGTALTTAHFAAGSTMTYTGTVGGNGETTGLESLTQGVDKTPYAIQTWRETQKINKDDRQKTFIKSYGGYWWSTQEDFMMKRDLKSEEIKMFTNELLINQESVVEGNYNTFGGFKYTCTNNGSRSNHFVCTQKPTMGDIRYFLSDMLAKKAMNGQSVLELDAYCGTIICNVINDYIIEYSKFSGTNSTFNLDVKSGFNVWILPIDGVFVKIHKYSFFDDVKIWGVNRNTGKSNRSDSMLVIDWQGADSLNSAGRVETIQPYSYAGANLKTVRIFKGMDIFEEFKGMPTQSELDSLRYEVETVKGYGMIPENIGLLERQN